jgi:hypothetical protein
MSDFITLQHPNYALLYGDKELVKIDKKSKNRLAYITNMTKKPQHITLYEDLVACVSSNGDIVIFDLASNTLLLKENEKNPITQFVLINTQELLYITNRCKKVTLNILHATKKIIYPTKQKKQYIPKRDKEHFVKAVEEHRLLFAYLLTQKYPLLKEEKLYNKLEMLYLEKFKKAQILIQKQDFQSAKEILNPFLIIHKKRPQIKMLLSGSKLLKEFLSKLKEGDFNTAFELTKKEPILKEFTLYKETLQAHAQLLKECNEAIVQANFTKAQRALLDIKSLKYLQKEYRSLDDFLINAQKLYNLYNHKNYTQAYTLLFNLPILRKTHLAQLMLLNYKNTLQKAEKAALAGSYAGVKEALGALFTIQNKSREIKNLLRLSFYIKIDIQIEKKEYMLCEKLLYSYFDIFGKECEIEPYIEKFEKYSGIKLALSYPLAESP